MIKQKATIQTSPVFAVIVKSLQSVDTDAKEKQIPDLSMSTLLNFDRRFCIIDQQQNRGSYHSLLSCVMCSKGHRIFFI